MSLTAVNNCFLIFSVLIIIAAFFFWGRDYERKNLHISEGTASEYTAKERLIFCLLLGIALLARLWQFGSIPGGMNQDGAMAAVDAKALADHATDRYGMFLPVHFTAWGYGQMSTLLSYCMVPFIKLFGLSPLTARLPILIASMCGLIAVYAIIRLLLGTRAAQIALLLAVFNPWHFMQSRWALDCNMFPHMFILGLLFLLLGLFRNKRWVYLSMLFFALCMYSYGISFYTVPVFLLVICLYIRSQKLLKWTDIFLCAGIYILLSWPIYLTMAINTFRWNTITTPFFTMPFFPQSVRSRDILFFADNKPEQLRLNILAVIRIFTAGDHLLWNSIDGYGAINLCFVPFIFLGLYYMIYLFRREKDARKKTGELCLLCFFGIGLLAGILTSEVNINRINIILYPFILFAAVGICFVYRIRTRLAYTLMPVYLLLSMMFLSAYFTDYAKNISSVFFADFIDAVRYADAAPSSTCLVITPDSQYRGSYHVSEILTLYALEVDAEYYQCKHADENGLYYPERYYYTYPSVIGILPEYPIAYVVKGDEISLFPKDLYEIRQFGSYYTAIPTAP